jgi:hypothetical protein
MLQIRRPAPAVGRANPTSRPSIRPRCPSERGWPRSLPDRSAACPRRGARALFAAAFRPGDVVLNIFSYHLTRGGFIFDASARALGCAHSGRSRHYRGTIRADRGLSPGRLRRHAGFSQDPARRRGGCRARRLFDIAGAGLGRGVFENRCRTRSAREGSMPIRRWGPPISA